MSSSNPSQTNLLSLNHISKKYGTFTALNDVSFSIKKGEIFGYIGPNGAGKTTTMKIIVGLIHNYSGELQLNGKTLAKTNNEIHKFLGYLPQEVGFQNWRTVNHLLITFGRLSGYPKEKLPHRIDEVLQLVGLKEVKNKKIVHLSGGMQQKLRLAQALLHEPTFLVLDEPMTGLDPTSRYQMKNIIRSLTEQEITIFLSSHILSDVQDIANRIGIINHGRILNVGTPQQLQSKFQVGYDVELITAESAGFQEFRQNILDAIQNTPGIQKIEHLGNTRYIFHLESNVDIDEMMHKIMHTALQNKWPVRNLNLLQPSLEEVYLKYVQEEI